jgi:hypothetical protein
VATYFTDRDLGKRFPEVLAAAGVSVETHHRHFAPDAEDDEWIPAVAERGWIAVTHNKRIRYTPNELTAVFDSGLGLIALIGQATTLDLAHNFVRTHQRIELFVAEHQAPYIAKVYRPPPREVERNPDAAGRIEIWKSEYP